MTAFDYFKVHAGTRPASETGAMLARNIYLGNKDAICFLYACATESNHGDSKATEICQSAFFKYLDLTEDEGDKTGEPLTIAAIMLLITVAIGAGASLYEMIKAAEAGDTRARSEILRIMDAAESGDPTATLAREILRHIAQYPTDANAIEMAFKEATGDPDTLVKIQKWERRASAGDQSAIDTLAILERGRELIRSIEEMASARFPDAKPLPDAETPSPTPTPTYGDPDPSIDFSPGVVLDDPEKRRLTGLVERAIRGEPEAINELSVIFTETDPLSDAQKTFVTAIGGGAIVEILRRNGVRVDEPKHRLPDHDDSADTKKPEGCDAQLKACKERREQLERENKRLRDEIEELRERGAEARRDRAPSRSAYRRGLETIDRRNWWAPTGSYRRGLGA